MSGKLGDLSILCSLIAAVGLSIEASAQTTNKWKQVGNWEIQRSKAGEAGFCMAATKYPDGTWVFLSVAPISRQLSLMLVHPRWRSVEDGREYPVTFSFDGAKSSGTVVGNHVGDHRGIEATLTLRGIVRFMTANNMSVTYKGEVVSSLSLGGTYAAALELKNCQEAVNPDGWPFVKDDDPFRR